MAISVIINTWNEEANIKRCIDSVISWVNEVIVVDMNSTDQTREIALKLGAHVYTHPPAGFVEPARNFAIEKARNEWILVVDADEEIGPLLATKIQMLTGNDHGKSFFRIPRKNIIFGRWIRHARWWPDLQIRLFKKGMVTWLNEIHSIPVTKGEGVDLEIKPDNAITHYNYSSISQYISRMDRYTTIQASEMINEGIEFRLNNLIKRPTNEFISRYLAGEGYKDGLHGFVVCLLQSISEFILYLKLWEKDHFKQDDLSLSTFNQEKNLASSEINYWIKEEQLKKETSQLKRIVKRVIS